MKLLKNGRNIKIQGKILMKKKSWNNISCISAFREKWVKAWLLGRDPFGELVPMVHGLHLGLGAQRIADGNRGLGRGQMTFHGCVHGHGVAGRAE